MPEKSTTNIRKRVTDACVESLTGEDTLGIDFIDEVRALLEEIKPPKADAFVSMFDKHSESTPNDSAR